MELAVAIVMLKFGRVCADWVWGRWMWCLHGCAFLAKLWFVVVACDD